MIMAKTLENVPKWPQPISRKTRTYADYLLVTTGRIICEGYFVSQYI